MQGICIYGVPSVDVSLFVVTGEGWSKWFLLYGIMSQPHYTLLTLCGGCSTKDRDLCEWASYKLLCSEFHLALE